MSAVSLRRPTPDQVFAGGGAMGAMMRQHDWAATPLGRVEEFPQSLRTALSILLDSRFPMYIAWGREFIQFYNDDYRPILGSTKHPAALGISTRTTFAEIWDIIGPMFDGVMAGNAVGVVDFLLPLDRHGYVEECYFTFSYSPIRDESQQVGGVLVTVSETTGRVLGERRLKTLGDLAKSATDHPTVEQVLAAAAEVLARNPKDIPFFQLWLNAPTGELRLAHAVGCEGRVDPARLPLRAAMAAPEPLEVRDIAAALGCSPAGPWPEPPSRALIVPVAKPGQAEPYGLLLAGISPRRALDDDYRSFLGLVAGHLAAGIATARAYQDERRRAAELAELDRAKTAFFSNVSHEFRTPLTLLLGPIEEAIADREEPPRQRERLEVAHRNALRLQRLVNTLLDFSRMEAGRIDADFRETDLAALTGDLASAFRSAFERAGIAFAVRCERTRDPVYVDHGLWEKIVFNLLSNAFKFTRAGSVTVALRQLDDAAVLTVADTGTGIAEADVPRVFERFHRIPNAQARTQEGSGIGLSLARDLVHLHGGTISVRSEPGRGSEFTVRIPVGRGHLPTAHPSEARAGTALGAAPFVEEALRWLPDSGTLPPRALLADRGDVAPASAETVLWVDDNADMRDYVARLLRPHWRVVTAEDGAAALRSATEFAPDLVISDVMMPGIDGFALLAALRADPRTRDIPVILLSARAGEDASIDGMSAGADDYLVKPFTARELLARVRAHLALARQRREAIERERALRVDLARSNRDLEHFASIASHDLQEPLRSVSTHLSLIEHRYASAFDDRGRGYLAQAIDGASRMHRLTGSLLDYAKVARDGARLAPIALDLVLDGVLASLAPMLAEAGASVTRGPLPEVIGDATLVGQLLQNLIANAIRYRSERPPALHIHAQESGDEAVISVADNGVGIDAQDQARIFLPFFRAAEHVAGTGLGLAICKRIIERHGGRIWVESSRGSGSTFRFTARLATGAAAAQPPAAPPVYRQGEDEFFRSVFMQAPASIAIFRGPEHVFEFTNPRYLEMLGRVSVVGQSLRQAFPEISDSGVYEVFDRVYATGEPFVASEYPIPILKRGSTTPELCYFSFSLHPLRDRSGAIYGQIGVALDITPQVTARRKIESLADELLAKQEALASSEARFRELAEAMPQIVFMANPQGVAEYYNRRWSDYTGLPEGAYSEAEWRSIVHPDDADMIGAAWQRCLRTSEPFDLEYRLRDRRTGAYRWHLGRAVPVRGPDGAVIRWYGTVTDIDAQRQAEAHARQSEQSLSLAVEATGIGTWDYHPVSGELRWSKSSRDVWGLGPEEPVRFEAWIARIHDDDRSRVLAAIDRAMQRESGGGYQVEFRMRRFDNDDERWLAAAGRVLFSGDGRAERFIGTTRDITAMKQVEFRQRFLDDARTGLVTATTPEQQLLAVAEVAVPRIADWCTVDLVVDGARVRLGHVHADARRIEQAADIRRRFPSRRGDPLVQAVSGGKAVLFDDLQGYLVRSVDDQDYVAEVTRLGLRSSVIVPIQVRGQLFATLSLITSESGRRYGEDDRRFGDELARHISTALERSLLHSETLVARREAETLNAVGISVASELKLEKAVQVITDAGTAAIGAQFGAFFYNVIDRAGERYTLYTIAGVPREKFSGFPMPRATALFGPTFRGEGVIRLDDVRADARFGKSPPHHGMPPGHLPVVSYLAVPVKSRDGEVLGGLFFGHPEVGRFTVGHERLIVGIAAQAAIAIDNARLFDAAVAKTDALARANDELQQFAYVSSHDLQEPLRTVTQYLDLLELRYADRLDDRGRRFIAAAVESTARMQSLIGDLLSYSRLGSGAAAVADVPLREVVDEVVQDLGATVAAAQADIRIGDLPTVPADATKMRLLFQNLIGNALKFRSDAAPVVRLSATDTGATWTIGVTDNGIGIAPEHRERIFDVFQRLHHREQYAGSGIGLAICKRIVGQHGGRIWVESTAGEGASFRFTMPKVAPGALS